MKNQLLSLPFEALSGRLFFLYIAFLLLFVFFVLTDTFVLLLDEIDRVHFVTIIMK